MLMLAYPLARNLSKPNFRRTTGESLLTGKNAMGKMIKGKLDSIVTPTRKGLI